MALSEHAASSSASASHICHPGRWIVTILCCTYALLPMTLGESLNSKRIRLSPTQTREPSFNIPEGFATDSMLENLICTDKSDGRFMTEPNKGEKLPSSAEGETRTLITLLLVNRCAERNKINSHDFKENDSLRQLSDILVSLMAKNDSYIPTGTKYRKRIVTPYDKKVFVYGKDDRVRIYPPLLRKFPYSNIVRLSTGCTGTLVTPQHVLTAAHCVHNGVGFRNNLEMLKVEILDSMGVRAYYIEKIGIPSRWLHPRKIYEHQASWDYAVVRLSFGVHGRSQFFPLAVPTAGVLNENLQFLGFPNNRDDLWMSICPARSNKAMVDGNLILTRCDSAVGNSGAAVLSDDSREGKKIIGVLSSTMPVGRMPYYTQFSIITALTWAKLYDICAEIGELGVSYRVCPPLDSIPRLRRFHISNNVIPFFG